MIQKYWGIILYGLLAGLGGYILNSVSQYYMYQKQRKNTIELSANQDEFNERRLR
jgi:hypothetical protein